MPILLPIVLTAFLGAATALAATDWEEIPPGDWKGASSVEVAPLGCRAFATIATPTKEAAALEIRTRTPRPAGLYEVRLTLRSSHAHEPAAFYSHVACAADGTVAARWEASAFAISHRPEIRIARFAHAGRGPLAFSVRAEVDEEMVAKLFEKEMVKREQPRIDPSADSLAAGLPGDDEFSLEFVLNPVNSVYFLVDKVEIQPLSLSGVTCPP